MEIAHLGFRVDSSQARKAKEDLKGLKEESARTEASAAALGRGLAKAFAGIAAAVGGLAALAGSARSIRDFESSLSRLQAVSGATASQMVGLRDIAKQMGATTRFSASEAADALNYLAMAGFSATEAIESLPGVLSLAAASGVDLATTADIASNVLSGFQLSADQAGRAADVLAAISSKANTNVTQVGSAMAYAAPVAAAFGISMEEAAAAVGVLSNAGIQSTKAGTALRAMLSALAAPTDKAKAAFAQLNLSVDELSPSSNTLTEIFQRLARAGLTAEQAIAIFGREAASGALAAAGQSEEMERLTEAMENAEGTASDMASTMSDNLDGDLRTLWSTLESVALAVGEAGLGKAMRFAVQMATAMARAFRAVVEAVGWVFGSVDRAMRAIFGLGQSSDNLARALYNVEVAARQEMAAVSELSGEMAAGVTVSVETAQTKLEEALARRENIAAMVEEAQAVIKTGEEYRNIENEINGILSRMNEFNSAMEEGRPVPPHLQMTEQIYDILEQRLINLREAQEALLNVEGPLSDAAIRNAENIRTLEVAIAAAEDGVVTFTGNAGNAEDAVRDLATAVSEATGVNWAAVPGLRELRAEYGEFANQAQLAMQALNQIALSDFQASLAGVIEPVRELKEEMDLTAGEAAALTMVLSDIENSGNVEVQAKEMRRLADFIVEASGGMDNLSDAARAVVVDLYDASIEASRIAGGLAAADPWAQSLAGWLNTLAGNIRAAGPPTAELGRLLSGAAGAARGLGAALRGVLSLFGKIGQGLTAVSATARGISYAMNTARDVLGQWGVNILGGTENVDALATALGNAGSAISDFASNAAGASEELAGGGGGTSGGGGGLSDAAREAEQRMRELRREIERWDEKTKTPIEEYNAEVARLNELMEFATENGIEFGETYRRAMADLQDNLAESIPWIDKLGDALGDWAARGFKDLKDVFDEMKSFLLRWLGDMVAQFAKRQLLIAVGVDPVGSGFNLSSLTGGAGLFGGGGAAGGAAGAAGGAAGGLGSILGTWGGATAATAGSGFLGGLGATLGATFGPGGGIGGLFSIGANASIAGGGFMATLGAALPVLGAVALAVGLFTKRTKELDRGLRVTIEGMDTMVEQYRKVETSRLFGLIKSESTSYEKAAKEIADPIRQAVSSIQTSVIDTAATLGVGTKAFKDFSYQVKLSTKGMTDEEAVAAIQEELEGVGNAFAGMIKRLKVFANEGETSIETLDRLSVSLMAVHDASDLLGHRMHATTLYAGHMASTIVEAAGGMQAFTSAVDTYFSNFYTQEEMLGIKTRRLQEQFRDLGLAIPKTRDQFRELVESIDTSTEEGARLYGQLLSLSGAFAEVTPAARQFTAAIQNIVTGVSSKLDNLIAEIGASQQENLQMAQLWYQTAKTLRDFIVQMRSTASALITPEEARVFAEARYQNLLAASIAGDNQAATDLPGAAKALLDATRVTAGTREELAFAQARVLSDLKLAAGVADIEGARFEVISKLQGEQVKILEELRDYILGGGIVDPDMLDDLNDQLGALQGAIKAAEMINYSFLKERLDVTVGLIADADIPDYLKKLLGNAAGELDAFIDFIARTDKLSAGEKWVALTGVSEHIKTITMLAKNDLGPDVTKLALANISQLIKTVRVIEASNSDPDARLLGLTDVSILSTQVRALIETGSNPQAIALGLKTQNRIITDVKAIWDKYTNDQAKKVAISGYNKLTSWVQARKDGNSNKDAMRLGLAGYNKLIAQVGAEYLSSVPVGIRKLLDTADLGSGRLQLGGSFAFDPTQTFRNFMEGTTVDNIAKPIDALRADLEMLAGELRKNTAAWQAEKDLAPARQIASGLTFHPDKTMTVNGQTFEGLLEISRPQLASLADKLGIGFRDSSGELRPEWWIRQAVENKLREMGYISGTQRLWRNSKPGDPAWTEILGRLFPAYASGGLHSSGWALVGEEGPELAKMPGGTRVYSSDQSAGMMRDSRDRNTEELQRLREELREMKQEQRSLNMSSVYYQRQMSKLLSRINAIGVAVRNPDDGTALTTTT